MRSFGWWRPTCGGWRTRSGAEHLEPCTLFPCRSPGLALETLTFQTWSRTMRLAKVLTLGLGLAANLAARAGAQEVAGTVTDARNGKPIEGARVSVANVGTVRSDARGRF